MAIYPPPKPELRHATAVSAFPSCLVDKEPSFNAKDVILSLVTHVPRYSLDPWNPQVKRVLRVPGIQVDARSPLTGSTALHLAASHGHTRVIHALLAQGGASTYVYDERDFSPLMCAAGAGHADVVALLLSEGAADAWHHSAPLEDGTPGSSSVIEAAAAGRCGCVMVLAEEGGRELVDMGREPDGHHPLLAAASAGNKVVCGKVNRGSP